MATLDRTRALMAELATVIGLPELPQDPTGGYHLTIGETDIFVYGGDDEFILVVVPIAPLPLNPDYALMSFLFHSNMFNSPVAPFVVATDEAGTLIQWGRLRIADFDGTTLARVIDNLADRAVEIRGEIGTEA